MNQRLLNRFGSLFLMSLLFLGTFNAWAEEEALKEGFNFSWPVSGRISRIFGIPPAFKRRKLTLFERYVAPPASKRRKMHAGLDIAARRGTSVKVVADGEVVEVNWQKGLGKVVTINHGNRNGENMTTVYGHLSSQVAYFGENIKKGQIIGKVGSTGNASGSHLHFEVRLNGKPVNPRPYLK